MVFIPCYASYIQKLGNLLFVLSSNMVSTSLPSDGQVYLVDEEATTQAMQILDIRNMPVDPQFQVA